MRKRTLIGGGIAAVAVVATIGGVAAAGNGDDGPASHQYTQEQADAATQAALDATGGGTANSVETDNENGATYEVEVTKTDGTTVDVRLDETYRSSSSRATPRSSPRPGPGLAERGQEGVHRLGLARRVGLVLADSVEHVVDLAVEECPGSVVNGLQRRLGVVPGGLEMGRLRRSRALVAVVEAAPMSWRVSAGCRLRGREVLGRLVGGEVEVGGCAASLFLSQETRRCGCWLAWWRTRTVAITATPYIPRTARSRRPCGRRRGSRAVVLLDDIDLRDRQVDHGGQDRRQEDDAGQSGAEADALLAAGQGEQITQVGAERASQDVGQPEGEDRVGAEPPRPGNDRDQAERAGSSPGLVPTR